MFNLDGSGWDPTEWEKYCLMLLRLKHGNKLVPVPDKSGGDGGLEAFSTQGTAWQAYAPEGEPLTPRARYIAQRDKITRDLRKLQRYELRIASILGTTILSEWILLTPKHESAALIEHCQTKGQEVLAWKLPFIGTSFAVTVQTLDDFPLEHRALQEGGIIPGDLNASVVPPVVMESGSPFSHAVGPLIEVMDGKLAKVIPNEESRGYYRGELLGSKVGGDELLARYAERVPDVAEAVRREISLAKRAMLMRQAVGVDSAAHLNNVRDDVAARVTGAVNGITKSNSDLLADAALTGWLQECSMDFPAEGDD
jgi:hypothetical protein